MRCLGLVAVTATLAGCLMNSVHRLDARARRLPDSAHAIVVIGVGLEVPWPHAEFEVTLAEYSAAKGAITGNCFRYNRIEAARSSIPGPLTYFAFEVPANVYVFLDNHLDARLKEPFPGGAFVAPPKSVVYFGDYVLIDANTIEFRQNTDAARTGAKALIPFGAEVKTANSTVASGVHMFVCTP